MAASRARFINWSRLMPRRSESRRATWMPAYRPSAIMIPYQWIFRPPIVTNTGSIPILISTDQVYEFRVAGFPASNLWFRVARSEERRVFPSVPVDLQATDRHQYGIDPDFDQHRPSLRVQGRGISRV